LEDKRNFIMAILLAGLILVGGQYITSRYFPAPKPVPAQSPTTTSTAGTAAPSAGPATPGGNLGTAPNIAGAKTLPLNAALASSGRVRIQTPKLKGSINLQGAQIDDLLLLAHRTELAKNSPPVRLFAPSGTEKSYFARFGWVASGITVPDDKTVWTTSAATLTPATPVTLSWTNETAQKFEIILTIDKDYLITAEQRFTNGGGAPVQIKPFGLISRAGKSEDHDTWNIHVGPMGVFNGTADYDWDYTDLDELPSKEQAFKTTGGWIGFTDKYWLAALIPDQKIPTAAKMITKDAHYWTQMVSEKQNTVAAGQSFAQTSRLFAGAKEVEVLDNYVDQYGIDKLDYAIDWGWFRIIEKAFFKILHFLFLQFGSFGAAIIGLTFVVRIFLFPIAQRQFSSMAQMRAVQPKMKALQDKHKEDKPKLQQEMMQLYKDEKVNPLAGCLPIFLQMPIFFGLYKLLMLTIEMRHQPFLSPWINDLSSPDPWTPINLFGLIPWDLPSFLAIGILPILLGFSMWGIQKLNPQPMDDIQKQVCGIMPWMMMFMFARFASGLQVYYVVSNCLTILQQKWLYSRHPILKQQAAKDAEDKAAAKAKG
jgi:YidC/Oxa1 family membrane protein insertase